MKYFIIICLLGISIISFPDVFAQNDNLFVSANSSQFNNTFAGPMVIEVRIKDMDIDSINKTLSRPEVLVANKTLEMVQTKDGNWYGYFADRKMAEIADGTTSINGNGLDFGGICDIPVARKNILKTDYPDMFKDASKIAYNDSSCGNKFDKNNLNVLRAAKQANDYTNYNIGQANLFSAEVWPFIQLFDFSSEEKIVVQYNKNKQLQKVTLTFESPSSEQITLSLDGDPSYVANSPVLLTLNDTQLNIDPTDEDSWTFTTKAPGGLFYQFFDRFGNSDYDGTLGAVDISPYLSDLMFKENGLLLLDPYEGHLPAVVNLQNTTFQTILVPGNIDSARSEGNSLIEGSQPITFRESGANSASFNNHDGDLSNLIVSEDAKKDSIAWLEYSKKWYGILVKDHSISWDKSEYLGNETASLTINNEIMNKNSKLKDSINVKIHSRYDQEGIELKVKETKIDSGIFTGSITLYNLQNNECMENRDSRVDKLCVFDEDRIYASFSYPKINGTTVSSNAKSTVSDFHKVIKDLPMGNLTVNFPKSSDYYFTAIEQLEEKLEANNFTNYSIETYKQKHTDTELVVAQTITIDIANRIEYDKIFDHNKFKNFTDIDEDNITKKLRDELKECSEMENSDNCDVKIKSLLDTIDSQIGKHNFTESIFYEVSHDSKNNTKLPESLTSEPPKFKYHDDSIIDWAKFFPIFQFLNFDLVNKIIPNAMAIPKNNDEVSSREFLFLNGFSYGFGFGKSFEYEYVPEGMDEFFSTEARFAFGLGVGLRIPINITVTTNPEDSLNSTSNTQKISFTVGTLDLKDEGYENLGLPNYQEFEGHEFAAYLGPELHATAGIFEKGPSYEYEKELPKPSSEHFTPPLGEDPVEFTNFDISVSEFIPYLDFAKFFFTVDAYAGFNGDLEGDEIKMEVVETDIISFYNSTKPPIIFKENNESQFVPFPEKSSLVTIGNLTYNSSLNFKPKIGGEAYFMGVTILSEEIELGNLVLPNIVLHPHQDTPSTHSFLINGISDGFYKGILDIEDHQVHYLSSVGSISYGITNQTNGLKTTDPDGNEIWNQTNSIILPINATSKGQLIITLPKELINTKIGNDVEDIFVRDDDDKIEFNERVSSTDRTLTISFPAETQKIEIGQTRVVPEFGIISVVVLGMALTSIIALTFRSQIITRF